MNQQWFILTRPLHPDQTVAICCSLEHFVAHGCGATRLRRTKPPPQSECHHGRNTAAHPCADHAGDAADRESPSSRDPGSKASAAGTTNSIVVPAPGRLTMLS